jgi:membrane-anchored glycerophosphoryl diester phosphodiesterase (GDPDase)
MKVFEKVIGKNIKIPPFINNFFESCYRTSIEY